MKPVPNIHFHKNGQTRYVKHGFSWQLCFFGPLAFLMRGQWPLALLCSAFLIVCAGVVVAFLVLVFDAPDVIDLLSIAIPCALVGQFGNRLSARSYVKNGWLPVEDFPADWNMPPLLPATPVVQAAPAQSTHTTY